MSDAAIALRNNPPLVELLAEEVKPFQDRATALIENVKASRIVSPETAAAVTTLGSMLRDLRGKVETARKERADPFDAGKAAVQAAFKAGIIDPVDEAMGACKRMLDAWRKQLDEQAAKERELREAQAAAARHAAETAEMTRQKAEAAGDTGAAIRAEMEALQAAERAEKLESDADTIRPGAMIRTQAGSAGTATTRVPTVTNIGLCLRWMLENQSAALHEAIAPILARLARAKVEIPGVEVAEVQSTRFRR